MRRSGFVLLTLVALVSGAGHVGAEPKPTSWGTAHPCVLDAADPEGGWIVLCQAREDTDGDGKVSALSGQHGDMYGDTMVPYVIRGGGAGERVDAYVRHSHGGRYLVVVQKKRLVLLDMRKGTRVDLSARDADATDGMSPFGHHRAASFDRAGRHLLTIRKGKDRARLVVLDLKTNKQAVVDPGPGLLWRAEIDATGHWVIAHVVTKDTDGNGRLDVPRNHTTLADRGCRGSPMSYSSLGGSGDLPVVRVAPIGGGVAQEIPGFIAPVGAFLLRRDARGALLLRDGKGKEKEVASPDAKARLVRRHPEHGAFEAVHRGAIVRRGESERPLHPIWLHTAEKSVEFSAGRAWKRDDLDARTFGHWLRVFHNSKASKFIHLTTGRAVGFDGGTIAFHGDRVYGARIGQRFIRDLVTGKEWPVTSRAGTSYPRFQQGPMYASGGDVVDMGRPAVLGSYKGKVLAMSRKGYVLQARDRRYNVDIGPLRWTAPQPR